MRLCRPHFLSLTVLVVALGLALAACGSGDDDGSREAATAPAAVEAESPGSVEEQAATDEQAPPTEPEADVSQPAASEPEPPAAPTGEPDTTAAEATGQPARAVAASADATRDQLSSRLSFTVELRVPDQPRVIMSGEGAADYANERSALSYDMSELLAASGVEDADGTVDVIVDGQTLYMRFPLLSNAFPDAPEWLRVDLTSLGELAGVGLQDLGQLGQGDPSQALDYLRGASNDFAETGSEEVRGVETTKYSGTIDLGAVAERAPSDERDRVQEAIDALVDQLGSSGIPVEVWIDADGLMRRFVQAVTVDNADVGGPIETETTIELYDFGTDIEIELPDPADVGDLAPLLGLSSGSSVDDSAPAPPVE